MKKARVVCLLLVALICLSCISTGVAAGGKDLPTIRFAHGWTVGDGMGEVGVKAINDFAEAHKDEFTLLQEVIVGDEMKSKIRIDIAGNNIPDAWMYWGSASDAGSFVKSGILLDVAEYLAVTENTKYEDFPEGSWDGFRIDGKVWGIPLQGFVGYWFCNRELFEKYNLEYPKTYEELLSVSEVFNANGIVPLAMGSKAGNPGHFFMSELYTQYPGAIEELRGLSSTWQFDTENIHKVCNLIAEMKAKKVFPSDTIANGDWGPSFALYNDGRAAMVYSYTWMLGSMNPAIVEVTDIIPTPKLPGATVDPATIVSRGCGYGMLINKKSFEDPAKRDALVALADLISSDAFVEDQLYLAAQVPGKEIEIDESRIAIPMMAKVLQFAQGKNGMTNHWLNFPATKPWADAQNFLDELFAGSLTPDEYIQKVQDSLDIVRAEEAEE